MDRRFFASVKSGGAAAGRSGYPAFKRYGDDPGIRFPDPKQLEMDNATGRLKLPKLGWLRLRLSQQADEAEASSNRTRRRRAGEHHIRRGARGVCLWRGGQTTARREAAWAQPL